MDLRPLLVYAKWVAFVSLIFAAFMALAMVVLIFFIWSLT